MFGMEWQILSVEVLFAVGYILLVFDQTFRIPRTIVSLWVAIGCWFLLLSSTSRLQADTLQALTMHMVIIAQVSFFQLGATSILGIANTHDGFHAIARYFPTNSKKLLMIKWSIIAFLMSSVFNNVLSTVLMLRVMLSRAQTQEDKCYFGAAIVMAANSGGSWTPIGDLTTNVLWVGGQISSLALIQNNWLPALVSFLVPLFFLTLKVSGEIPFVSVAEEELEKNREGVGAFLLAILVMSTVPVVKWFAGFPPFLCTLFGLSLVWLICEQFLYRDHDHVDLRLGKSLTSVDLSVPLYILSILLSVKALETAGVLKIIADYLDPWATSLLSHGLITGAFSTVIDNVPVATAMTGMYSLKTFPMDDPYWHLVILCAGTAGSILGIGSVAGLGYISVVGVRPGWYLRNISWMALLGFLAGLGVFLLQHA